MANKTLFKDLFIFQTKSKIKAGDGLKLKEAPFPFYTSSNLLSKSTSSYQFEDDSLIFGTGGQASIHFQDSKFSVSTDCLVAKPKSNLFLVKYIYHYLNGNINILEDGFKGAGLKHISKAYIETIEIPLPPLSTQKAIAEKLDKADALRKKDKELMAQYDELAQAIFIDMFGDPVRNEKGWKVLVLSDLIHALETGVSVNSSDVHSDFKILKTSCVYSGDFNPSEAKFIVENELSRAKLNPRKDSIIISRMNTTDLVCKCSYIDRDYPNLYLPDRLWQTTKSDIEHNVRWLSFVLSYPSYLKEIQKKSSGTSGSMKNISKGNYLNAQIIYPPAELQNQFAEKIENIEAQKAIVKQQAQQSEDLFQALLQESFNFN